MQNILINTHSLCQVLGRWGVPKLSEIDAPEKTRERDENGAVCYNQQRELVHRWAEI